MNKSNKNTFFRLYTYEHLFLFYTLPCVKSHPSSMNFPWALPKKVKHMKDMEEMNPGFLFLWDKRSEMKYLGGLAIWFFPMITFLCARKNVIIGKKKNIESHPIKHSFYMSSIKIIMINTWCYHELFTSINIWKTWVNQYI